MICTQICCCFFHTGDSEESKPTAPLEKHPFPQNCPQFHLTSTHWHQLNKRPPKVAAEIFLPSESASQNQPLFWLQFGKTAALQLDSFQTASADFKAKVKPRDCFVVCNRSAGLLQGFFSVSQLPDREIRTENSASIVSSRYFCWLELLLHPPRYEHHTPEGWNWIMWQWYETFPQEMKRKVDNKKQTAWLKKTRRDEEAKTTDKKDKVTLTPKKARRKEREMEKQTCQHVCCYTGD